MSEHFSRCDRNTRDGHSYLSAEAEEAVGNACARQLELVQDRLRFDNRATLEECREAAEDWYVDECLILDLDLDDRLTLVDHYAEDYGLELGTVAIGEVRSRIETLSATIVGFLGEERARDAFREIEELLEEKGQPFDELLADNPYELFRHHAERDESPWRVYEYRNLEGDQPSCSHRRGIDLYEMTVAGVSFYIRCELQQGTPNGREHWPAT